MAEQQSIVKMKRQTIDVSGLFEACDQNNENVSLVVDVGLVKIASANRISESDRPVKMPRLDSPSSKKAPLPRTVPGFLSLEVRNIGVHGAGIDEVNGLYFFNGRSEGGAFKFARHGMYKGEVTTFLIFRGKMESERGSWYLTVRTHKIDFIRYFCRATDKNESLPPPHGWNASCQDVTIMPAPSLTFGPE